MLYFPPQHSSDTGTIKLRVCEPPVPIDSVNIHQSQHKTWKRGYRQYALFAYMAV